jgi:hypothetical protein
MANLKRFWTATVNVDHVVHERLVFPQLGIPSDEKCSACATKG